MRGNVVVVLLGLLLVSFHRHATAQQMADTSFDVSVARPAHGPRAPRLAIDEAHNNFHTATGRYAPFAALMRNDGLHVAAHTSPFTVAALSGVDILVIANAASAGSSDMERRVGPAFTADECDVIRDWVRAGGALLLVADHAPFGSAAEELARRFGVVFGSGYVRDSARALPGRGATTLQFTGDALGDHAILAGRHDAERVRTVVAFQGQSLAAPAGAVTLLRLSARATESEAPPGRAGPPSVSVAGRAQGIAMEFGLGRVVMLGEAAMLSAQVIAGATDREGRPLVMGMNVPGNDNKQFALNIVRWLSGVLEPAPGRTMPR